MFYFSPDFTHDSTFPSLPRMSGPPLPDVSPITIHHEGVTQSLLTIQPNKAGPDNLPACFLKEVVNQIIPALSIFQASLHQGYLPDIWKTTTVVPIYKKGSKTEPSNYRSASLTLRFWNISSILLYQNILNTIKYCLMSSMDFIRRGTVNFN